jgi:hypothetical protein
MRLLLLLMLSLFSLNTLAEEKIVNVLFGQVKFLTISSNNLRKKQALK